MRIERFDRDCSHPKLMGSGLIAHVPCKINLFLEVLGKRPDGYHDLDTIMLAVDWCDTLILRERNDSQISLKVEYSSPQSDRDASGRDVLPKRFADDDPAWDIPSDERNLVVRALRRLQSELEPPVENRGAEITLIKRIPAQAGLGGGSADAAAALVLGSLAWSGRLHWSSLCRIAAGLGSDLNFFLEGYKDGGWTAHCTGRGEIVEPVPNVGDQHVVIAHPPQGCNTAEIFRNLTDQPPQSPQTTQPSPRNSSEILRYLAQGDNVRVGAGLYNRLDLVARECNPWIDRTARWFDRYKPLGQCLSGSGSARFCLCSDRQEAEKIGRELASFNEFRVQVASAWHAPSIQEQARQLGFGD